MSQELKSLICIFKNLYLVIKNVSHFFKWNSGFSVGIYFISNFCIHLKYTHFVDFFKIVYNLEFWGILLLCWLLQMVDDFLICSVIFIVKAPYMDGSACTLAWGSICYIVVLRLLLPEATWFHWFRFYMNL